MCGICGIYHTDGKEPEFSSLAAMLQKLVRRGPDHEGTFSDGGLALGHRRLSIIDLSERSDQPMVDSDTGLVIVFNGTIYNYPQLKRELQGKGHHFFSSGDTEVIIKAYKEWGADCVTRLHGMFAFVIWDKHNKTFFMARDRLGIKPLYYSFINNTLVFASNMQAILASNLVDKDINPEGLHYQLSLHGVIPAPNTIIRDIKKLPPGYSMTIFADGNSKIESYWQLSIALDEDKKQWDDRQWTEAIHDSLMSAVSKRLTISDVPVGVLLSGGLDSSLLVALLAEAGVHDLRTFSIGFNDIGDEKGSEFEFSDQIVSRYQTQHKKFKIPNSEVLSRLPDAIDNMSEPMVGQDAVAFYLLSEKVSQEVKVVQSGQGADELFAGYFWYPMMQQAKGSDANRFMPFYVDREHDEYLSAINHSFLGQNLNNFSGDYIQQHFANLPDGDYLNKVLHLDVSTLIVDDPVKRVDNMTMAWGLEARVPFLDHELVELAAQMPSKYKYGASGAKHMLKTISRGKIPDAVIDRPKGYFPMPALKYVRGEFYDMMKDVLESNSCRQRNIFNPGYIKQLLDKPEASENMTRLQGSKLWHMALLEKWFQQHNI
ncbi:MAG: N-acetylglutaminylglutamine amidotransferase [Pseudomonadota bacterium]